MYVCFFFSLCFCSVVSLSFRVLHIFLCIFRVLYEVWCICLCSKLWFLTSRVWIETLRSSVVCGARFCKVFLFFVFFFGLFSFVCLFVPLNAFHTQNLRTDHYCYFLRAIDANFCIVYKSSICMFFFEMNDLFVNPLSWHRPHFNQNNITRKAFCIFTKRKCGKSVTLHLNVDFIQWSTSCSQIDVH